MHREHQFTRILGIEIEIVQLSILTPVEPTKLVEHPHETQKLRINRTAIGHEVFG